MVGRGLFIALGNFPKLSGKITCLEVEELLARPRKLEDCFRYAVRRD